MQVLLIVFKLALAAKETIVMLYNEILSSGVKLFKNKTIHCSHCLRFSYVIL